MGGIGDPQQSKNLLGNSNLRRKSLLENKVDKYGRYVLDKSLTAYNINEEKKRVVKLKISDENKHQYVSCLAGKEGGVVAATGLAGGVYKEYKDLKYKLNDKE